jgi:hypothetical protein
MADLRAMYALSETQRVFAVLLLPNPGITSTETTVFLQKKTAVKYLK